MSKKFAYKGPGVRRFKEIMETPKEWHARAMRVGPQAIWHAPYQILPAITEALDALAARRDEVVNFEMVECSEGGQVAYESHWFVSPELNECAREVRALHCLRTLLESVERGWFRGQPESAKAFIHREVARLFEFAFLAPVEIRRREGNSKGGKGKQSPHWYPEGAQIARTLLAEGKGPRGLRKLIAQKLKSANPTFSQIGRMLDTEGIVKIKKRVK